eukprot:1614258-Amphidinium_carterae.1
MTSFCWPVCCSMCRFARERLDDMLGWEMALHGGITTTLTDVQARLKTIFHKDIGTKNCTTATAPKGAQKKKKRNSNDKRHQESKHFLNLRYLIFVCVVLELWGGGGGTIFGP